MNKLKTVVITVVLTFTLAGAVFADGTSSPSCASPGEVPTIPGPCALVLDSTEPGQIETPPATDTIDIMLLAEIALGSLLIF